MPPKIFILHSSSDADDYLQNNQNETDILFCTHASVQTYLSTFHTLQCTNISDLITNESLLLLKQESIEECKIIVNKLDQENSALISQLFRDEHMKIFQPVFSYLGSHQLLGYKVFIAAVTEIIKAYPSSHLFIYDAQFNDIYPASTSMKQLITTFLNDTFNFTIITKIESLLALPQKQYFFQKYPLLFNKPYYYFKKFLKRVSEKTGLFLHNIIRYNRETIILYGSLYNLHFLLKPLTLKYKILYFSPNKTFTASHQENGYLKFSSTATNSMSTLHNLLADEFVSICSEKSPKLITMSNSFNTLVTTKRIKTVIWGNSPIYFEKALFIEFLKCRGVKIIGAQHGSSFVEQIVPEHFTSDFDMCDYYISHGFTDSDIRRSYPSALCFPDILPFGCSEITLQPADIPKTAIDILFPLTNSASIFAGGVSRIPFGSLCSAQKYIINFLDHLSQYTIYVKPMMGTDQSNSCIGKWSYTFQNIHYLDTIGLDDFLKHYIPKIAIIEYPSTPLQSLLVSDTEIFLLMDPILPYEQEALSELQKRVHCYDSVDQLISGVESFLAGELSSKRDNTFLHHYIYKQHSKQNIVKAIHDIIEG
jgi:hypothetical protein